MDTQCIRAPIKIKNNFFSNFFFFLSHRISYRKQRDLCTETSNRIPQQHSKTCRSISYLKNKWPLKQDQLPAANLEHYFTETSLLYLKHKIWKIFFFFFKNCEKVQYRLDCLQLNRLFPTGLASCLFPTVHFLFSF